MFVLEKIFSWLFPCKFDKKFLGGLPLAPKSSLSFVFSIYNYESPQTKEMIRYLKTYRDPQLVKNIAEKIVEHNSDYLSEQAQFSFFLNPIIIPVPISRTRRHKRGFNQSEILALYCAKYISGGKYDPHIVKKTKTNQKQSLVTKREDRFRNIKNSFHIDNQNKAIIKNKDIIIIDDLITTGATILELRTLLKNAGARNIIAFTIAH